VLNLILYATFETRHCTVVLSKVLLNFSQSSKLARRATPAVISSLAQSSYMDVTLVKKQIKEKISRTRNVLHYSRPVFSAEVVTKSRESRLFFFARNMATLVHQSNLYNFLFQRLHIVSS
jgi:hypothetical protein